MDQPFFYGSQTCGMCIAMHGTGPGSGRKSSVRLALAPFELYNVAGNLLCAATIIWGSLQACKAH